MTDEESIKVGLALFETQVRQTLEGLQLATPLLVNAARQMAERCILHGHQL